MKRNKLELTWVGKDERPRIEPRVLVEDPAVSYRAEGPAKSGDIFDDRIIFGDNLLALKALVRARLTALSPSTGIGLKLADCGSNYALGAAIKVFSRFL